MPLRRRFSPPPFEVPPEVKQFEKVLRQTKEERDAAFEGVREKADAVIASSKRPPLPSSPTSPTR